MAENLWFKVALKWCIHIPFISVDEYLVFRKDLWSLNNHNIFCMYCDLFHILLSSDIVDVRNAALWVCMY
jgi:hypothetical protein